MGRVASLGSANVDRVAQVDGGTLAAFEGGVVRTRGSNPVVVEGSGGRFEVAPPAVSPVDTTGAGDVFAGYLAAELAGRDGGPLEGGGPGSGGHAAADVRTAVEVAATASALSVDHEGVQRATPRREAVEWRP